MKKRWIAAVLVLVLLLLSGCNDEPGTVVYVQNVGELTNQGSIGMNDRFAGVVVSENATKVTRDYSRTISMLYVSAGQDVKQGDVLFAYDSEALELQKEKQELELQRLQQNSTTLQSQITQLQAEQKKASKEDQLSYTVNIQERQAQLKENEYNINMKKREIAQTQATLANAQVTAPISGRIVSISDENSGSDAYITIQQAGTYRVKASLNELNRGSIYEGVPMIVTARTDDSQVWYGTVSSIDVEGGSSGDGGNGYNYGYGFGPDEYSGTTKYPFFIELQTVEGLMLGQHVYVEIDNGMGEEEVSGLWLPEYFIVFEETEGEEQPAAYVWADNGKDRLEKRTVTLGAYNEMLCAYEILDGLTAEDYIAFPDNNCAPGVGTTRNPSEVVLPENGDDWTGDDWNGEDWTGDDWSDDWSGEDLQGTDWLGGVDDPGVNDDPFVNQPVTPSNGTTGSSSGGDLTPGATVVTPSWPSSDGNVTYTPPTPNMPSSDGNLNPGPVTPAPSSDGNIR